MDEVGIDDTKEISILVGVKDIKKEYFDSIKLVLMRPWYNLCPSAIHTGPYKNNELYGMSSI